MEEFEYSPWEHVSEPTMEQLTCISTEPSPSSMMEIQSLLSLDVKEARLIYGPKWREVLGLSPIVKLENMPLSPYVEIAWCPDTLKKMSCISSKECLSPELHQTEISKQYGSEIYEITSTSEMKDQLHIMPELLPLDSKLTKSNQIGPKTIVHTSSYSNPSLSPTTITPVSKTRGISPKRKQRVPPLSLPLSRPPRSIPPFQSMMERPIHRITCPPSYRQILLHQKLIPESHLPTSQCCYTQPLPMGAYPHTSMRSNLNPLLDPLHQMTASLISSNHQDQLLRKRKLQSTNHYLSSCSLNQELEPAEKSILKSSSNITPSSTSNTEAIPMPRTCTRTLPGRSWINQVVLVMMFIITCSASSLKTESTKAVLSKIIHCSPGVHLMTRFSFLTGNICAHMTADTPTAVEVLSYNTEVIKTEIVVTPDGVQFCLGVYSEALCVCGDYTDCAESEGTCADQGVHPLCWGPKLVRYATSAVLTATVLSSLAFIGWSFTKTVLTVAEVAYKKAWVKYLESKTERLDPIAAVAEGASGKEPFGFFREPSGLILLFLMIGGVNSMSLGSNFTIPPIQVLPPNLSQTTSSTLGEKTTFDLKVVLNANVKSTVITSPFIEPSVSTLPQEEMKPTPPLETVNPSINPMPAHVPPEQWRHPDPALNQPNYTALDVIYQNLQQVQRQLCPGWPESLVPRNWSLHISQEEVQMLTIFTEAILERNLGPPVYTSPSVMGLMLPYLLTLLELPPIQPWHSHGYGNLTLLRYLQPHLIFTSKWPILLDAKGQELHELFNKLNRVKQINMGKQLSANFRSCAIDALTRRCPIKQHRPKPVFVRTNKDKLVLLKSALNGKDHDSFKDFALKVKHRKSRGQLTTTTEPPPVTMTMDKIPLLVSAEDIDVSTPRLPEPVDPVLPLEGRVVTFKDPGYDTESTNTTESVNPNTPRAGYRTPDANRAFISDEIDVTTPFQTPFTTPGNSARKRREVEVQPIYIGFTRRREMRILTDVMDFIDRVTIELDDLRYAVQGVLGSIPIRDVEPHSDFDQIFDKVTEEEEPEEEEPKEDDLVGEHVNTFRPLNLRNASPIPLFRPTSDFEEDILSYASALSYRGDYRANGTCTYGPPMFAIVGLYAPERFCLGTTISPGVVITCAHCIVASMQRYSQLYVGPVLNTSASLAGAVKHHVLHVDYFPGLPGSDLAVIYVDDSKTPQYYCANASVMNSNVVHYMTMKPSMLNITAKIGADCYPENSIGCLKPMQSVGDSGGGVFNSKGLVGVLSASIGMDGLMVELAAVDLIVPFLSLSKVTLTSGDSTAFASLMALVQTYPMCNLDVYDAVTYTYSGSYPSTCKVGTPCMQWDTWIEQKHYFKPLSSLIQDIREAGVYVHNGNTFGGTPNQLSLNSSNPFYISSYEGWAAAVYNTSIYERELTTLSIGTSLKSVSGVVVLESDFSNAFINCPALVKLDGVSYFVEYVVPVSRIFQNCSSFNLVSADALSISHSGIAYVNVVFNELTCTPDKSEVSISMFLKARWSLDFELAFVKSDADNHYYTAKIHTGSDVLVDGVTIQYIAKSLDACPDGHLRSDTGCVVPKAYRNNSRDIPKPLQCVRMPGFDCICMVDGTPTSLPCMIPTSASGATSEVVFYVNGVNVSLSEANDIQTITFNGTIQEAPGILSSCKSCPVQNGYLMYVNGEEIAIKLSERACQYSVDSVRIACLGSTVVPTTGEKAVAVGLLSFFLVLILIGIIAYCVYQKYEDRFFNSVKIKRAMIESNLDPDSQADRKKYWKTIIAKGFKGGVGKTKACCLGLTALCKTADAVLYDHNESISLYEDSNSTEYEMFEPARNYNEAFFLSLLLFTTSLSILFLAGNIFKNRGYASMMTVLFMLSGTNALVCTGAMTNGSSASTELAFNQLVVTTENCDALTCSVSTQLSLKVILDPNRCWSYAIQSAHSDKGTFAIGIESARPVYASQFLYVTPAYNIAVAKAISCIDSQPTDTVGWGPDCCKGFGLPDSILKCGTYTRYRTSWSYSNAGGCNSVGQGIWGVRIGYTPDFSKYAIVEERTFSHWEYRLCITSLGVQQCFDMQTGIDQVSLKVGTATFSIVSGIPLAPALQTKFRIGYLCTTPFCTEFTSIGVGDFPDWGGGRMGYIGDYQTTAVSQYTSCTGLSAETSAITQLDLDTHIRMNAVYGVFACCAWWNTISVDTSSLTKGVDAFSTNTKNISNYYLRIVKVNVTYAPAQDPVIKVPQVNPIFQYTKADAFMDITVNVDGLELNARPASLSDITALVIHSCKGVIGGVEPMACDVSLNNQHLSPIAINLKVQTPASWAVISGTVVVKPGVYETTIYIDTPISASHMALCVYYASKYGVCTGTVPALSVSTSRYVASINGTTGTVENYNAFSVVSAYEGVTSSATSAVIAIVAIIVVIVVVAVIIYCYQMRVKALVDVKSAINKYA